METSRFKLKMIIIKSYDTRKLLMLDFYEDYDLCVRDENGKYMT